MMKKFAKGMAAFLMVLMALTLLAPICHAAEENGNYSVEVHINHTPVKVEVNEDTWILTIKNQSEEPIYDACVKITVGDFSVTTGIFKVNGLENYEVEMKNYLDEDFLKVIDVKIDVYGVTRGEVIDIIGLIIVFVIVINGLLFLVVYKKSPLSK